MGNKKGNTHKLTQLNLLELSDKIKKQEAIIEQYELTLANLNKTAYDKRLNLLETKRNTDLWLLLTKFIARTKS
jgi:hypothetical protein